MALLLANVALSDTFNTWRVRTNQIIADAASTSNTTTFAANVGFTGFVTTSLIPSANVTLDLGSAGNAWRDLYLSGNTIFLGDATISTGDNRVIISFGGSEIFNAQAGGAGSFDGTVTAPTVIANTLTGTISTAAQPNITSVGTLTSLSVGQITGTSGAGFAGLVTAPTVNANTVGGTLSTAAQPNITSVGALNSGSIASDFGNINIGTSTFTGNGSGLTTLNAGNVSTGTLAVVRGGTGVTTSTGTGNVVLSTSPTLVTPALGTPSSGNLTNCTFPTLNQNTTGSAASLTTARTINGTSFNGTANITITAAATNVSTQLSSLGVGTAASGTTGEIRATNNVTAFFSDKRLKTDITPITDALSKVCSISGVTFKSNDIAAKYGYTDQKLQVGVIAQEIKKVLPQVVVAAPFDIGQKEDGSEYSVSGENFLTVQYDKLVPLLIEAIKELKNEIESLKTEISNG